jgi:two-component system, chemotaxis family, sensor kinase CheA
MDDLLTEFLTETNESLAELDVAVVRLERTPDDQQTLSKIFRLVHTIKGTCGFLGLEPLERVAHAAESVLGRVRDGSLAVTPDIVSLVLAALDRVKAILGGLATSGAEPAGNDDALIAALTRAAEGEAPDRTAAEESSDDAVDAGLKAPPPVAGGGRGEGDPERADTTSSQTIRVAVDVLEDLMTMASELVLVRNQLLQLGRAQESAAFAGPLQRLSLITSELQEGVMKTRMQPIGNAWNKLPRLVRDLTHELNKKIELTMLGADTELDRQVLELIKDPLTHMVRNSADHGLESPADRHAAGKPETGHISLNAFHEGGYIIIEVSDDGRGLSAERIGAAAVARGLATDAELATMTEAQIQRFIFRAGFSTASAVTAVSGRGVGMDVVKTNVERIGGAIDLKSVAGSGTTFTIKIPLTLAIVSALVLEAGGERFAIPQVNVIELVQASRGGAGNHGVIERVNETPVLRLRDRLLPLVSLRELLRLDAGVEDAGTPIIIVIQVGAGMLGIIVDRVFDTEEIVVKPVAPILRHVTMFSGNTILGDGSVIMILDPNGIARASGIAAGAAERPPATARADAMRSGQRTAMLLFRAGGTQLMAVPLSLVSRIEEIERTAIESSGGALVTQYRGRLMPLVGLGEGLAHDKLRQAALVFAEQSRSVGLMVDEIVDVIEDRLDIELSGDRPGLLGTAIIGGRATDVIDTGYWLTRASQDWFRGDGTGHGGGRILAVEDSAFFRQLLVPTLAAAGYSVTATSGPTEALRLREAGEMFEAIVSDIEMPDMDGLQFVRAVRADGPWAALPVIALSSRATQADMEATRAAGFTGHVAKFDREALIASLRHCLAEKLAQ